MTTFNAELALEQIEGDRETLAILLSTFQRVSPEQIAEMRQAIEAAEGEKLASVAHCLKGSLGLFAAEPAAALARQIEEQAKESNFEGARMTLAELEAECARLAADLAAFLN